jgi:anthranilate phosphoribosyltransferase
VVGVSDPARAELMAGALAALGTVHALVVHGAPGMDEVSPLGETSVVEVQGGALRRWTIDPADLGFAPFAEAELAGAGPQDNAAVIESVLRGAGAPAAEAAVVLNASAALYTAGRVDSIAAGVTVARESIRSGAAMHALERLRRATRSKG